jgi:hypothetical protein
MSSTCGTKPAHLECPLNPPIDVGAASCWDLPPPTPRGTCEVMFASSYVAVKTRIAGWARGIRDAIREFLGPSSSVARLAADAARDLVRSRRDLVAENALLRQQLIVLRRCVDHPKIKDSDRVIMLLLARLNSRWSQALHIVNPVTLLRWHRRLFEFVWRRFETEESAGAARAGDHRPHTDDGDGQSLGEGSIASE